MSQFDARVFIRKCRETESDGIHAFSEGHLAEELYRVLPPMPPPPELKTPTPAERTAEAFVLKVVEAAQHCANINEVWMPKKMVKKFTAELTALISPVAFGDEVREAIARRREYKSGPDTSPEPYLDEAGMFDHLAEEDDCRMIADAVLGLARPPQPTGEGDGWRPMETAPKDGTPVMIVWRYEIGKPGIVIMRWECFKHAVQSKPHRCPNESDCDMNWLGPLGSKYGGEAILWQPLPAIPANQTPVKDI